MGNPRTGHAAWTKCVIDGVELDSYVQKLEWKAFVNNGYIVRARLRDPGFAILKKLAAEMYLKKGRNEPMQVTFHHEWKGDEELKTEDRIAYLINLYGRGRGEYARLEFIAIDPPTWLLSRGKADGKHYEGSVSDVIRKVCQENGVSEVDITKTIDNKKGNWWMMRQDPKTFILSLLNWSSSVTPNKTKWVVTSKDKKLFVKEEYDIQSEYQGLIKVSTKNTESIDITDFELLMDNFSHVRYAEEHTAGISAVSGYYIDRDTEDRKVRVYDKTTGNKTNTDFNADRGFKVTNKEFATFRHMIPEDSAGLGIKYQDFIDGTARNEFLNMLGYMMRMKLTIFGDKQFDDPSKLGVATVNVQWIDGYNEPYFLSGPWLVHGYHHTSTPEGWSTDVYINRLDYDAAARKVGKGGR
jgi:hypothetical protein